MQINRRLLLKNFLIIAGGVTLIPACVQKDQGKTSIPLKNMHLSGADEKLLAELSETIIPKTNTPGAKDTYTHIYLMKMMDDCRTKEDQQNFEKGLKAFKDFSDKKFNQSFTGLTPQQRTELLQQIEDKKEVSEEVTNFYNTVKGLTIQGYLTSQHYLSTVRVYKLVPGRFQGCVPVDSTNKKAFQS